MSEHRLPLNNEELARAEQEQANRRRIERARLERESIERDLRSRIGDTVLRAAEGTEGGDSMEAIANDIIRNQDDINARMRNVLRNFASAAAGTGLDSFADRRDGTQEEVATPAPTPKAAQQQRSAPPPPKPAAPQRRRRTVAVDDEDADSARLVRNMVNEFAESSEKKPDAAMRELLKMCEVWSKQAMSNPLKANRDFAVRLRRNMPLFILSPQIEIGKLTALVNAVIKIDESAPMRDTSDNDEALMTHVRKIQQMIDSMPEEDTDYRPRHRLAASEEGEGGEAETAD